MDVLKFQKAVIHFPKEIKMFSLQICQVSLFVYIFVALSLIHLESIRAQINGLFEMRPSRLSPDDFEKAKIRRGHDIYHKQIWKRERLRVYIRRKTRSEGRHQSWSIKNALKEVEAQQARELRWRQYVLRKEERDRRSKEKKEQREKLARERVPTKIDKKQRKKLRTRERNTDYYERAKRLVEITLLPHNFQQQQVDDNNLVEEQTHVIDVVETKKRLERMRHDVKHFLKTRKQMLVLSVDERVEEQKEKLSHSVDSCERVPPKIGKKQRKKLRAQERNTDHYEPYNFQQLEMDDDELVVEQPHAVEETKTQMQNDEKDFLITRKDEEKKRLEGKKAGQKGRKAGGKPKEKPNKKKKEPKMNFTKTGSAAWRNHKPVFTPNRNKLLSSWVTLALEIYHKKYELVPSKERVI